MFILLLPENSTECSINHIYLATPSIFGMLRKSNFLKNII